MTKSDATPTLDSKQKRFKGSLAGTLVRTLLVFTFIPFAIMAGAAYFRARTLLREQAVVQFQNLMATHFVRATKVPPFLRPFRHSPTYEKNFILAAAFQYKTERGLLRILVGGVAQ